MHTRGTAPARRPSGGLRTAVSLCVAVFAAWWAGTPAAGAHTPPPTVALYDDTAYPGGGSWPTGLAALRALLSESDTPFSTVEPPDVASGALARDGYDLLLVGGGWAAGYRRHLSPDALAQIRAFVAGGGVYVGICAGAYLAADLVAWRADAGSPGGLYDYPLDLLEGVAAGPVLSLKPWTEPTGCPNGITAGAVMTSMRTVTGADLPVLYYGGPLFRPTGDGIAGLHVLARYDAPGTRAHGEPALIRFPWGAGWVVLISPHLEVAFADCRYRYLPPTRDFLFDVLSDTLALAPRQPLAAGP